MNKEFTPHVVYEGKTKALYMKVLRAIYCCLESAMLWYNLYITTLKGIGFELNLYDPCLLTRSSMTNNVRLFSMSMTTK